MKTDFEKNMKFKCFADLYKCLLFMFNGNGNERKKEKRERILYVSLLLKMTRTLSY
jgi:hypothetical protein